mgnify:CR=1 FL=1
MSAEQDSHVSLWLFQVEGASAEMQTFEEIFGQENDVELQYLLQASLRSSKHSSLFQRSGGFDA